MEYYTWRYGLWFTLFGRMFYASYNPEYQPLFSERYGYRKLYRIGGFVFKTEKRKDI